MLATELEPETQAKPSVSRLVSDIVDDAQRLVRQQLDMLKAEIREDVSRTKTAATYGALGVTMMTVGGLSLVFGIVYLLHEQFQIPMWIAWAGLGGTILVAGLICGLIAKARFESFNPLPDKTAQALKENLTWKTQP